MHNRLRVCRLVRAPKLSLTEQAATTQSHQVQSFGRIVQRICSVLENLDNCICGHAWPSDTTRSQVLSQGKLASLNTDEVSAENTLNTCASLPGEQIHASMNHWREFTHTQLKRQ